MIARFDSTTLQEEHIRYGRSGFSHDKDKGDGDQSQELFFCSLGYSILRYLKAPVMDPFPLLFQ
jgi:hypothetical protein